MDIQNTTKLMTVNEASNWLSSRDNFLILTHSRPDGDTLGSACGLCSVLRDAGKTAYVLTNPQITKRYASFTEGFWTDDFKPDFVLAADIADESLLTANAEQFKGRVDFAIDHHPSNTGFAVNTLLDAESAACGEIIYKLAVEMSGKISEKTATLLFIAVTTDTGGFRYGNTTSQTLRIASELMDAGAPGTEINKIFFRTKSRSRIEIETEILNNLEFFREGKVAAVVVTQEMLKKTGVDEDDLEDIASILGQIEGVVVSITIRERSDLTSKISVRSNQTVDSGAICAKLGGGGHLMAAGANFNGSVWEAKKKILEAVGEVWK